VEEGESPEEAAAREVLEEVGIRVLELERAGVLEFYSIGGEPDWVVYVYRSRKFEGEPRPSDEAEPRWFKARDLPFNEMWVDDRVWLPHVLAGRRVRGRFWFSEDYGELLRWEVEIEEGEAKQAR
ncbi:MAG: NUDIX hydrolase, partial [Thermoprotei archaeon]